MNKTGLFVMLLIIIGFLVLQHRTVPNVPLPSAYHAQGASIQIPLAMRYDLSQEEVWTLSKRADADQYFASVFAKERLLRQFATTKLLSADGGRTYATAGQIRVNGVLYEATRLHVNPDGRTGYIVLTRVGSDRTAGNPAAGTANG